MNQTKTLIRNLKLLLKKDGKTYTDVAKVLNLSEASIKRRFSENNFSLSELGKILESIGMDIADLVDFTQQAQRKKTELTIEQEAQLVSDPRLLLITVLTLSYWSLNEIVRHYEISESDCISCLLRLDKLGLIELRANNKIRVLISSDFVWRNNGPIQNFFLKHIAAEFLSKKFDVNHNSLKCMNGMMSTEGIEKMTNAKKQLERQFHDLCLEAANLTIEEKFGTTFVSAMCDWQFSIFEPYRRK